MEIKTKSDKLKNDVIETLEKLLNDLENDTESGIEEGIYDEKDNKSNIAYISEKRKLIEDFKKDVPVVYVYVEGGNIQGASASQTLLLNVFDKDNLIGCDQEEEKEFIENFGTPDSWKENIEQKTNSGEIKPVY